MEQYNVKSLDTTFVTSFLCILVLFPLEKFYLHDIRTGSKESKEIQINFKWSSVYRNAWEILQKRREWIFCFVF